MVADRILISNIITKIEIFFFHFLVSFFIINKNGYPWYLE